MALPFQTNNPLYNPNPTPSAPGRAMSFGHVVAQPLGWLAQGVGSAYDYLTPGKGSSRLTDVGKNITSANVNGHAVMDASLAPQDPGYVAPMPSPNTTTTQQQLNGTGLGTGGGGGGGTQTFQDTTQARLGDQATLTGLDQILANKLQAAEDEYNKNMAAYSDQDAQNEQEYNTHVNQNETNREDQHQAALLAAAQGGRGLYSALAAIGALGGTGKLLANRAVAQEANTDLGNADKTFGDNATNLTDTYKKLKQQEDQQKNDAATTRDAAKQDAQYNIDEQRQNVYKDLADLWTKAGNNTEADNASAQARSFTTSMANNTHPMVSPYAKADLQYSAPALKSYLAGANDMTVKTAADGGAGGSTPINGAIYTDTKKRDTAPAVA